MHDDSDVSDGRPCPPVISVVIPALNEQTALGACLTSLTHQDYAGTVEVIVVDNGTGC